MNGSGVIYNEEHYISKGGTCNSLNILAAGI
jgi:hypothetical protein